MKKIIKMIADKVYKAWQSGTKGKLACLTFAGALLLIGSCLFCSNESAVKSFEEIKGEAQAKYSEMTSENWEDGARLINSMFADMAGELWKCNIKFVELLPNGILLEERSSGLPIQITQNSAGEIVFTSTITENNAITLWNMVLPIAMLKVQAGLDEFKMLAEKHDAQERKRIAELSARRRKEAEAAKLEAQRKAERTRVEIEKFDAMHDEFRRFVAAFNESDKTRLNAAEFLEMGIDVTKDGKDVWVEVKRRINNALIEEACFSDTFEIWDENGWNIKREQLLKTGFEEGEHLNTIKIFGRKWR